MDEVKNYSAMRQEFHQYILDARGVTTECNRCSGYGVITYGSCSTWRRGISGQVMTSDVCDKCWGSGDSERPWINLRKLDGKLQQKDSTINMLLKIIRDCDPHTRCKQHRNYLKLIEKDKESQE